MTAKLKLFTELLVFVILIIVFSAEAKPKNYSRTTSRKSGYMREHLLAFYIIIGLLGGLLGFVVTFACCLRCRDSCKQRNVVPKQNQDDIYVVSA